jgi:hypothetical protein
MLFRKIKITGKAREGWGGGGVCRLFSGYCLSSA